MSIILAPLVLITDFWTDFKTIVQSKNLFIQYDDDGVIYTIFAFDKNVIAYYCVIYKDIVPSSLANNGYSQVQNDTDKADFETNFKSNANKSLANILKPLYGISNQTITVTLSSLGNSTTVARASTAIDNTATLYEDVLFFIKVKSGAASTSATGFINVYGYGTVDGVTFPENITGTDASVTLTNPTNLILIAQVSVVANATTYLAGPFSFCRNYGIDRLPAKWGLVFVNQTGGTLDATAGNHSVTYQGINGQIT